MRFRPVHGPRPLASGVGSAPDSVTSVETSLISAESGDGFARLAWYVNAPTGSAAALQRRGEGEAWVQVGTATVGASGQVEFEDRTVIAGARYGYRLALPEAGGTGYSAEIVLVIPARTMLELAPVAPNPSAGKIAIEFSLPDSRAARLDVVDVGGRSLDHWDVGTLGPGRHELTWSTLKTVPAGRYFVRLRHDATTRTREFVIIR